MNSSAKGGAGTTLEPVPPGHFTEPPRYPSLYEINTRVWLGKMSREAGKPVTLAEVSDTALDDFADRGLNWVWLMGVWRRGPASRDVARNTLAWREEFRAALPDLTGNDICGSGFAIAAYEVDEILGGNAALAQLRGRLAQRGIRLMLDFVPNHTGLDHHWVRERPEYYIQGTEATLAAGPENYCRVGTDLGERILAHGRDPNFPGWSDTLQLNYANPALQAAQLTQLMSIASQCDGVRCDMAMLLLPEVFQRSWGLSPGAFWPSAITAVRQTYPGFTFLAEAYWDLESKLLQQGFDYCYDKGLYDRLRDGDADAIRCHLDSDSGFESGLARFLENHDEPRAASTFSWPQHRAAAVITFLTPGLRFFHQGQIEGARCRVPVQLCRGPVEPRHSEIAAFYERFLALLARRRTFRCGNWVLVKPRAAWLENPTGRNFVAYTWSAPHESS